MTRYRFAEVSIKGVKRWKDPMNGRSRQETKKFWQTINPFNCNTDGTQKTYADIMAELKKERDEWRATHPASRSATNP